MPSPIRTLTALLAVAALAAGCGASKRGGAPGPFAYDASAPLRYVDRGAVGLASAVAVRDISFRSGGRSVDGYLLLPPGTRRVPAVVVVHGTGGDRGQLLQEAVRLAARDVVVLTVTEPSTAHPPQPVAGPAVIEQQRTIVVRDVVAVRRAIDLLDTLPRVDSERIGYLGWSAGAKTGALLAASEPRIDAFALLSAGADPLSAFVANAPAPYKARVRRVFGSIDPIGSIHRARPGSVLLLDGRRDEVVPRSALENIVRAAPKDTTVRWYGAGHALTPQAYADAFAWLAARLRPR